MFGEHPGSGFAEARLARANTAGSAPDAGEPTRSRVVMNFVVFEAAWLACILGVARGQAAWGTVGVVAAVSWHIAISARPAKELVLIGATCAIGLIAESTMLSLGFVKYPTGQPVAWLAPYWLVALWGEFAIGLNVTLRWLKRRPILAALLGAVFGPLSFLGGVRLGGASFVDERRALVSIAIEWSLLMPLVVALSNQFDGVSPPRNHD